MLLRRKERVAWSQKVGGSVKDSGDDEVRGGQSATRVTLSEVFLVSE